MQYHPRHADQGVIALLAVIIIGAMIVAIGISTSFIAQTEIVLSGDVDREYSTRMLAVACLEEAAFRLKLNTAYVGGTIPIESDSCTVAISGSGSTRTVTATATVDGYTKTVTVVASLRQNAAANARAWTIDSWTEGDPP